MKENSKEFNKSYKAKKMIAVENGFEILTNTAINPAEKELILIVLKRIADDSGDTLTDKIQNIMECNYILLGIQYKHILNKYANSSPAQDDSPFKGGN